jgi:hypothetical protein
MDDSILSNYLLSLQTDDLKLIGVYRQGSDILGYSDGRSDKDYSVVWKDKFPEKAQREEFLTKLGFTLLLVTDQDHKGTDRFIVNNTEYNIAHQLDNNFLSIYNELTTEKVNEPKLYILGGFVRGKVIYDPQSLLADYKNKLVVTDEIIRIFKETRKVSTENNLKALEIAAQRQQPVEYVKSLNYLLITFCIQLYLQNKQFPMAPKWIEKDAEKFGWRNGLLDVVKRLKQQLEFKEIVSDLEKFSIVAEL